MAFDFDAYVVSALFDRSGRAFFALGDGTVRLEDGRAIEAHPGSAILCAAVHPSGDGVVTGGDDGRLVWTRPGGAQDLAEVRGKWIDAVAASPASNLIAFAAAREVRLISAADAQFQRLFTHEKSVTDLSFEAKGLRLAASTYGGAVLWYARIAEQKPVVLKYAGSHTSILWSPTASSWSRPCRTPSCTAGACPTARTCAWAAIRPRPSPWPSSPAA
ncbi:MAG: hypothetical protein WDN45_04415 [Caulobacteraceae bacterium]